MSTNSILFFGEIRKESQFFWIEKYILLVNIWSVTCFIWPASVAHLDARPTGDQELAVSISAGYATFFRGNLIMKYILRSFFPFR